MFRQFCIIKPSFFNATSGIHSRPFEGRHLVDIIISSVKSVSNSIDQVLVIIDLLQETALTASRIQKVGLTFQNISF